MKYIFLDLMFSRLKKFSLTNLVELRSWGFFGGSLDFIKLFLQFSVGFCYFIDNEMLNELNIKFQ
jgi:hypothetical protein